MKTTPISCGDCGHSRRDHQHFSDHDECNFGDHECLCVEFKPSDAMQRLIRVEWRDWRWWWLWVGLIIIAINVVLVLSAFGKDNRGNFDRWFTQVLKTAPAYHLKVTNDEAWREWFWLYCYQPGEPSMTPKQAVAWTLKEDSKSK